MASSEALAALAALIRDGENVISPYVRESERDPALGALAAAGPRAIGAAEEYVLLVEAIREGYLLHYETPRLIEGADADLRLLAGDFLYALGLERLAARGDLEAVRELADLISLAAQIHEENGSEGDRNSEAASALWLAVTVAVAAGTTPEHERAKESLRRGDPDAARELLEAATTQARRQGLGDALARAAESIGLAVKDPPDRG
jgi:hypothetical protein